MYKTFFKFSAILISTALIISCGNSSQKSEDSGQSPANESVDVEQSKAAEQIVEPDAQNTIVYANGFDGFVNIREAPTTKSKKLCEFKNGPKGAEFLGKEGEWTKINFEGTTGYILSKMTSSTPTIEYTGTVDVNWLEGTWNCCGYAIFIFKNGTYERGYDYTNEYGRYHLQNNEIVLVPAVIMAPEIRAANAQDEPTTLQINKAKDSLGDFHRTSYLGPEDARMIKEEDMCIDYGYCFKEDMKGRGQGCLEMINTYCK